MLRSNIKNGKQDFSLKFPIPTKSHSAHDAERTLFKRLLPLVLRSSTGVKKRQVNAVFKVFLQQRSYSERKSD